MPNVSLEQFYKLLGVLDKAVSMLSRGPPGPLDPADRVVGDEGKVAPEDTVSSQCKVWLRVLPGTSAIWTWIMFFSI